MPVFGARGRVLVVGTLRAKGRLEWTISRHHNAGNCPGGNLVTLPNSLVREIVDSAITGYVK